MSALQLVLLALAILATIWEIIKVLQIQAAISHHGQVKVAASFYVVLLVAVAIQVAFINTLVR